MDPRPPEGRLALKVWLVALIVAVIPGTHQEETTTIAPDALWGLDGQLPLTSLAAPVSSDQFLGKANTVANTVLVRRLIHVAQNRRTVCDTFFRLPWFEIIAEGVHVAIGPNTGIAKQVPCPTNRFATLQQNKVTIRTLALKTHCSADAGEARADDDDVESLSVHLLDWRDINRRIHNLLLAGPCRQPRRPHNIQTLLTNQGHSERPAVSHHFTPFSNNQCRVHTGSQKSPKNQQPLAG